MSFTPKPEFFLIRPGAEKITPTGRVIVQPATAVPLIPVDLLPEWVEVVGVPRSLSAEETKDMGNLGVVHEEQHTYRLQFDPISEDEVCASNEAEEENHLESATNPGVNVRGSLGSYESSHEGHQSTAFKSIPARPSTPQIKLKAPQGLSSSCHNPENKQQSSQPKPAPQKEPSPNPTNNTSSTPQLPSPCRHWCHHGVCKWGLDCHYEHIMPTSPAGLTEVGLSKFPDWWLQARGVMPMPPEVLRAADVSSARRMEKKKIGYTKRKPRFRVRAKRVGMRSADLDEASEMEAEDEYEEQPEIENEVAQQTKRESEGLLIEF
ncbi:transcription factor [Fusarium longipes]|uniref:Transcription factor n=1 Tax=Fusarium longipes TaxID=694270 RepID=A0A395SQG4_9HYPO|nr:transcription factor [Fusarium longipes]